MKTKHVFKVTCVGLALVMATQLLLTPGAAAAAQSDIGMYRLEWTAGATVYQALLLANDAAAIMLVKYFDESSQRSTIVAEQMELRDTAIGVILKGSNPVDMTLGRPHPAYAADNFIFKRDDDKTQIWNVDNAGTIAEVQGRSIRTEVELVTALKDFGLYDAFKQLLKKSNRK